MHPAKRGAIPASTPPLLGRLGMDADAFIASAHHFFKDFASAVGTPAKLIKLAANRQPPTANRQPPTPAALPAWPGGSQEGVRSQGCVSQALLPSPCAQDVARHGRGAVQPMILVAAQQVAKHRTRRRNHRQVAVARGGPRAAERIERGGGPHDAALCGAGRCAGGGEVLPGVWQGNQGKPSPRTP